MRKYGIFDFCLKVVFVLPPNLKIESKMHITVFNKVFSCSDSLLNAKTRNNKVLLIRLLIVPIVYLM